MDILALEYPKRVICGMSVSEILCPTLKSTLTKRLNKYWDAPSETRFLAPQPVSLELKDFPTLTQNEYMVTYKYNGVRFLLFLTEIEGICMCILVNRNMQFYLVDQNFAPHIFQNETLLDGELMDAEQLTDEMFESSIGRNVFVTHDALVICGFSLMNQNLHIRLKALDDLITNHYVKWSREPRNSFYIILKPFVSTKEFANLLKDYASKRQQHEVDGLVMYPVNEIVGRNTQATLFKWKEDHTIDFKIQLIGDSPLVNLVSHSRNNDVVFKKIKRSLFHEFEPIQSDEVFEFKVVSGAIGANQGFAPIIRRTDKPHGNNMYTVKKTLLNVKENIQLTTLTNLFGGN